MNREQSGGDGGMTVSIDHCECPNCKKVFEIGWSNSWLGVLFGEYAPNETTHTCEKCQAKFSVKAKKQIKMTTKLISKGD